MKDKLLNYSGMYFDGKRQYWFYGKGYYRQFNSNFVWRLYKRSIKGRKLYRQRVGELPGIKEELKRLLLA